MILERTQHYLAVVFIIALSLMYSLVFVATRAQIITDPPQLDISFISPAPGQEISGAEPVYFEGFLEPNLDYQNVEFVLHTSTQEISFPAEYHQNTGSWRSLSVWEPMQYPAGEYHISASAQIFQNGVLAYELESPAYLFVLAEHRQSSDEPSIGANTTFVSPINYQTITTDSMDILFQTDSPLALLNVRFDIHKWDPRIGQIVITPLVSDIPGANIIADQNIWGVQAYDISDFEDGEYQIIMEAQYEANGVDGGYAYISNYVRFSISRNTQLPEPDFLEIIDVISPLQNQVSGQVPIEVELSRPLVDQANFVARVYNNENNLLETIYLTRRDTTSLSYSGVWDTTTLHNGEALYPNASYTLKMYEVYNNISTLDAILTLGPIVVANPIEEPEPEVEGVTIITPLPGSDIILEDTLEPTFPLEIEFTFPVQSVVYDFYYHDDASIGLTSSLSRVSGGNNFGGAIDMNNQIDFFPSGIYDLVLEITKEDGGIYQVDGQLPTYSYNIISLGGDDNDNLQPEDILLRAYDIPETLSNDTFSIFVGSNIDFTEGLQLVWEDTSSGEKILSPLADIDDLQAEVAQRFSTRAQEIINNNPDTANIFVLGEVNIDDIPDGEYYVYARYINGGDNYFEVQSENKQIVLVGDGPQDNNIDVPFFEIFEPKEIIVDGRRALGFPFLTSLTSFGVKSFVNNEAGERQIIVGVSKNVEWSDLESYGILSADHPEVVDKKIFYLYFVDENGTTLLEDGNYYFYISEINKPLQTRNIYFSIVDGQLGESSTDNNPTSITEENTNDRQVGESVRGGASVALNNYTSCLDAGITDENICLRFRAMIDSLDDECIDQGIYDAVSCEDYLNRTHVDLECQEQGIVDREKCKDYLLEKYGSAVDCQISDIATCNDVLRNEYINRLVVGQKKTNTINNAVDPFLGKIFTVNQLRSTLSEKGLSEKVLPLTSNTEKDINVYIAKSQTETVLENTDRLTIVNQAVLMIDTDKDGLSDDLEIYYQTDPNNPDTDGDSYLDGQEIANGYDPLGPGRLLMTRNPLEQAVAGGVSIEQPKAQSKKIDKTFKVEKINSEDNKVKLSGKASPDTWVTLFLYSDLPLVMVTKTDESGNWVYDIKDSLNDGHHKVYVTVNDDTGKIVKQSSPVSFLVKSAQAVTADNYFDQATVDESINNMFVYYIIGAAFLIIIALVIVIYLHQRKSEEEIESSNG